MDNISLTFVALGAFWAGTSTVFTAMKMVWESRHRIVSGKYEGQSISKERRTRMVWTEWLPIQASLIGISLTLAVIITLLPTFPELVAAGRSEFRMVCYVASGVPYSGTIVFFILAICDFQYMRKAIRNDPE